MHLKKGQRKLSLPYGRTLKCIIQRTEINIYIATEQAGVNGQRAFRETLKQNCKMLRAASAARYFVFFNDLFALQRFQPQAFCPLSSSQFPVCVLAGSGCVHHSTVELNVYSISCVIAQNLWRFWGDKRPLELYKKNFKKIYINNCHMVQRCSPRQVATLPASTLLAC